MEVIMANRLTNSWELVKASASVLNKDKELLIFPIISAIGTTILTVLFFIPFIFGSALDVFFSDRYQILSYAVIFLFYILQYSIIFFANTALVGAAMIRLQGSDPTVSDGFRIAWDRFASIIGYALIAATVGLILKAASERSRGLGRFVVSLLGMSWNLATFLVVPVLAVEEIGPIEAVKRSASLLKRTWGEQIAGNLGMGLVFGLATFFVLFFGIGLAVLATIALNDWILPAAIILLMVLALILIGLMNSTLGGIYAVAVYQYATTGQSDGFFEPALVENTFIRQ
jgi:hypothetical protein